MPTTAELPVHFLAVFKCSSGWGKAQSFPPLLCYWEGEMEPLYKPSLFLCPILPELQYSRVQNLLEDMNIIGRRLGEMNIFNLNGTDIMVGNDGFLVGWWIWALNSFESGTLTCQQFRMAAVNSSSFLSFFLLRMARNGLTDCLCFGNVTSAEQDRTIFQDSPRLQLWDSFSVSLYIFSVMEIELFHG